MEDNDADSQNDSPTITRKTIVKTLAQETQLPQAIVKQLVDTLFDVITDCLVVNQRLELRNFGIFEVKKRAPRLGRNPKTKEEIPIQSRYVVTFKPGKAMDERLQQLMSERNED